jgi:hypothetical protein
VYTLETPDFPLALLLSLDRDGGRPPLEIMVPGRSVDGLLDALDRWQDRRDELEGASGEAAE